MAPGLISEGGRLCEGLRMQAPVSVFAEGKEHAICIGVMQMASEQIKTEKKGEAIQVVQFMNDGLWHLKAIELNQKQ